MPDTTTARANEPFTPTERTLLGTEDSGLAGGHPISVGYDWDDDCKHRTVHDMLTLGHLDDDTAAIVFAIHAGNIGEEWDDLIPPQVAADIGTAHSPVMRRWALFTRHHKTCSSSACDPSRDGCMGGAWWVDYSPAVTPDTPGAVPVTVLEP